MMRPELLGDEERAPGSVGGALGEMAERTAQATGKPQSQPTRYAILASPLLHGNAAFESPKPVVTDGDTSAVGQDIASNDPDSCLPESCVVNGNYCRGQLMTSRCWRGLILIVIALGASLEASGQTTAPAAFLSRYTGYPTSINPQWANVLSLRIRSSDFSVSTLNGDPLPIQQNFNEIFYGTFGDLLGDGSVAMVQASWGASVPNNEPGSVQVILLDESGVKSVLHTPIGGTTSPYIVDWAPGPVHQIFMPGFEDSPTTNAPNYLVTVDPVARTLNKTEIGTPIASHQSAIGNFENDGHDDILAVTYKQSTPGLWTPVLFSLVNGQPTQQSIMQGDSFEASSVAFGDINGDGIVDLVTGDTSYFEAVNPGTPTTTSNPDGHDNGTWLFLGKPGGGYRTVALPPPYFRASTFNGITGNFGACCGLPIENFRTHEVKILIADVNGDGRKDIIVSSMIWSDQTPFGVLQFLIQQPDGSFVDETASRLFGWNLAKSGAHQVWWMDVNGDGYPDIVISDGSVLDNTGLDISCSTQGNDVLLNDGEGHFISAMNSSFCDFAPNRKWVDKFIPYIQANTGRLGFIDIVNSSNLGSFVGPTRYIYTHAISKNRLSTGPNSSDPASAGVPGFNEWYYLFHYPDAKTAVAAGQYASGLAFYLAKGKARGDYISKSAAIAPGSLSGLWWNPNESGWGIAFTQRRNTVFAAWYTYDAAGNPKWYVAASCALPSASATSGACSGSLYDVSGPTFFGTAFNPSLVNVATAGNLQLNFADANTATMSYTVAGQTRSVPIVRQTVGSGTVAPAINYTDLWWNPNESGWGMEVIQQFTNIFLAWYVYDGSGNPIWYVASNCAVNGSGCSGALYRTTGPAFGPSFNPASVQVFAAGTVSLSFTDPNNGVLSYTVNGVSDTKTITRQIF